jgi:hypothetical protein
VAKTVKDTAALVRSKNAGPFWLTLDMMFDDHESYQEAVASPALSRERVAEAFGLSAEDVKLFTHDIARAIKISFPRSVSSGSVYDNDIFGGQQYAPLLDIQLSDD